MLCEFSFFCCYGLPEYIVTEPVTVRTLIYLDGEMELMVDGSEVVGHLSRRLQVRGALERVGTDSKR
jgi:hypothetical protein